jgi:superfamily II DNA or RNA helicase
MRLALHFAFTGDVVAFAAPTNLDIEGVYSACFRLTRAEEDGWIQWSSHTESYTACWLPGFRDPAVRALRKTLIAQADEVWHSSWHKAFGWAKSHHGLNLADVFLIQCTDFFVRQCHTSLPSLNDTADERSPYRVMYRGEEETLQRWQSALWDKVSVKTPFCADGWLIWRLLRDQFRDTGWREDWLWDRSGRNEYRLVFELVPPNVKQPSSEWRLVYYIAHNHWNLRAPLTEWWQSNRRVWSVGRDVLMRPDEWVLSGLAQAAEVSRAIRTSLKSPAPSECVIPPDEVFDFVTKEVPMLQSLGYEVVMPDLDGRDDDLDIRVRVQVRRAKQRGHSTASGWKRRTGLFQADGLVDFDWSVVIGDTELSKDEFEQLVNARTPYLHLGGSWKLIPLQTIYEQVQALRQTKQGREVSLLELSRAMLMNRAEASAGEKPPIALEMSFDDEASEARKLIDGLFRAEQPKTQKVTAGFRGVLRDYQVRGFSWLVHLRGLSCGACLADDMGLGKTVQVLAYLQYVKDNRLQQGPHLLICPTSLLQNWKAEMARFTPGLKVHIHHGANRNALEDNGETRLEHALRTADVIMTTYSTLVRDIDKLGEPIWDVVIADEAQNIKNAETKQSQAVFQLKANHRIALTGTPVENRLEELWSIFQFVIPGYLGSARRFRRHFVDRLAERQDTKAQRQLQSLLKPVLLRRKKTDPVIQMELPEKWEVREYAALTAEQAVLYQSIVNRLLAGIHDTQSKMARRGQILAALVRLKQVCDHPCLIAGGSADVNRSGKLGLLMDLLSDVVAEGEAALVFTQFRDMGELICGALQARFGWRPKFVHGGLSAAERGVIISDFQSGADESPVLVLSLKAGGVGLNLTRANHVFHFDRWWNPAVEDQATDRAYRIGQTRDVQVHKFVCPGTIEDRIDALISQKRSLSAAVVGESEGWITELDNDTLRSLITLDTDTVINEVFD